jgi:hypothetical protein
MSKHSHEVTWETVAADDEERVIQTNEILINYVSHAYVPQRGPSYASGGEPAEPAFCEFDGAKVRGNRGKWITLRHTDPGYQWAEAYFDANSDEFNEAAADDAMGDRADYEYDRRRDEAMCRD